MCGVRQPTEEDGLSKNNSESCKLRMEECLVAAADGRPRKERESARREEELTRALEAEDEKLKKEKEMTDKGELRVLSFLQH